MVIKRFAQPLEWLTKLSYLQLLMVWGALTFLFGCGYFAFASIGDIAHHGPQVLAETADPWLRFWNSQYFSIITASSVGYGDITPRGFSKLLAVAQSVSALLVFAIFVTKLVSYRQEVALREVHRLSFEDVFHNIREGLYIIRKDCDGLIEIAKKHKKMHEEDWETLEIAYKQAQSLITEIPDFYDKDNDLYMLDDRREQMLHEAIHRTLHRVNDLLDTMSKSNIDWQSHMSSMQALQDLIQVVNTTMPRWQEKSPYQRKEAFIDILSLKETVVTKMEKALPR